MASILLKLKIDLLQCRKAGCVVARWYWYSSNYSNYSNHGCLLRIRIIERDEATYVIAIFSHNATTLYTATVTRTL